MHSILVMLPVGRTGLKGKQNGQFQTLNIPMLKNYNARMGGVDLSGQLLQEEQESGGKHCFFILWIFLQQIHILYTEGMTQKDFRQCLANELLERSELQLNPNPSPGRPPRSSVRAEHCPVPLTSDHLAKKS